MHLSDPRWLLLPLALAILALAAAFKRKRAPSFVFLLKLLTITALCLALSRPYLEDTHESAAKLVLLDISDSLDESTAQELLNQSLSLLAGGNDAQVLPFAKNAAPLALPLSGSLSFKKIKDAWARLDIGQTNLEQALQQASALAPAALILISDGHQTRGNADDALALYGSAQTKIFPLVPEKTLAKPPLFRISQLQAPLTAAAQKSVDVRISALNTTTQLQTGVLEVKHDNKQILSERIQVPAGKEVLLIAPSDPSQEGIKEITAVLKPEDQSLPSSSQTIFLSGEMREKILLLSGAAEDKRLLEPVLSGQAYQLTSLAAGERLRSLPELEAFSSVILNNISFSQLPSGSAAKLEHFAASGGGFIMLGGSRSLGLGGYIGTPIAGILPVELLPPQSEQKRLNIAVMLVIDKSGSMAQDQRLEYSKEAAREVIRNLKNEDFIGVIGFDQSPFEVVRLGPVSEIRALAMERVGRLFPKGPTNLYPSMEEARRRLEGVAAGRKHMIVLTDGKLPDASVAYFEMVKQMRLLGITVSTVMVGSELDFGFLQAMAEYGGGAYYQTNNPSSLPKIFVQDVKVRSGEKTLKEQQEYAVRRGSGKLISTDIEAYPPLRGYVQTRPKPRANLELVVMSEGRAEPLLASWNYQQGKAIAFTSDANGRWSAPWVTWPRFQKFWADIVDAARPVQDRRQERVQFDLRHHLEQDVLNLDLSVFSELNPPQVTAHIIQPDGSKREAAFQSISSGRFGAKLENAQAGKYEIKIQAASHKLTPVAFFLSGELFGEKKGQGFNLPFLERVAAASGGRINPKPEDLSPLARKETTRKELNWLFLLLSAGFLCLEILQREVFWRWFVKRAK